MKTFVDDVVDLELIGWRFFSFFPLAAERQKPGLSWISPTSTGGLFLTSRPSSGLLDHVARKIIPTHVIKLFLLHGGA